MDELSGRLSPELERRVRAEMERLGMKDVAKLLTPELNGLIGDELFESLWEDLGGYEAGQRRILNARRLWERRPSARESDARGAPAGGLGED